MNKCLLLLVLIPVLCISCASTEILNNNPEFKRFVGQKYLVLKNCYIIRYGFSDSVVMPPGEFGLPKEFNKSYLGKTYNNKKIIGIINKNTVIVITSIISEVSFESQRFIIQSKLDGIGDSEINARWLFDITNMNIEPNKDFLRELKH